MAKGSMARRLLVAGAFLWVASKVVASSEAKPAPIELPDDVPEAAVAPAAETPKPADVDGPLVPKKLDDKVALAVDVAKSGVVA